MTAYEETRDTEQLRLLDASIDEFIAHFKAGKRTVFLFPGGLASRLKRATTAFQDTGPAGQTFTYETNWLTSLSFINGGALDLTITKVQNGGTDEFRDKDDRIMVALGDVDANDLLDVVGGGLIGLFAGLPSNPVYQDFRIWCDANDLNCFVFGWDWRRRIDDVGTFFIDKFLQHFEDRALNKGCANVLKDFALVGHSAGGMLVNWILRSNDPRIVNDMTKAITAGAPFYGYAGQVHRWFDGESLVNGPGGQFKEEVIKMISTFPGCYAWLFLDESTFNDNKAALKADPHFPLDAYPSMDVDGVTIADPYAPGTKTVGSTTFTRYPDDVDFDKDELAEADKLVRLLANPLSAAQQQKFYNIRGVQSAVGITFSLTAGSTLWGWDPSSTGVVVTNGPGVPGDGTQPAWTARHAKLRGDHVIDVKGSFQHLYMLSSHSVLEAVKNALDD